MNRRGASLLVVVLSLLVVASGAGLLFSISWMGAHEGATTLWSTRVRLAADAESERALIQWDPLLAETLPPGSAAALPVAPPASAVTTRDTLLRLGESLYLLHVVAEERSRTGGLLSRDGVARVVPLLSPAIPDSQAILALGPVTVGTSTTVSGSDQLPGGWDSDCPPATSPAAGLRAGPVMPVVLGCPDGTCVSGAPAVARDSFLRSGTLDRLGTITTGELVALADHLVSGVITAVGPVQSGPRCDRDIPTNWGDPLGVGLACSRYFPVIAAAAGARVEGGAGQGILIGLGRLELAGDIEFRGVVLARGPVILRDRARILGSLLATDSVGLEDAAFVARSRCAVDRARRGAGRPNRRATRGWIRWP
jgi:hypothetical protein